MHFLKESELREPVHNMFRKGHYSIYNEVRLFSRQIDIVAKKKSKLITVELKLRNWRRAIDQACLNMRVSNYSYIALPESVLCRIDRRMFLDAYTNGIGLISVDGDANVIMKPERSKKIQPYLRRNFLKFIREGNCK